MTRNADRLEKGWTMKRIVRPLVLVSVFLLPFCLSPATARALPADLDRMIAALPADTEILMCVDVAGLKKSPLFAKFRNDPAVTGEIRNRLDQLAALTGINLENDIDTVVLSINGKSSSDHEGLLLAAGRFQDEKVSAILKTKGTTSKEYQGYAIFTSSKADEASRGGLVFVDPSVVALGQQERLYRFLDVWSRGGKGLKSNGAMMDLVSQAKGRGQIWGVLNLQSFLPELKDKLPEGAPLTALNTIQHVQNISYSAYFGRDLDVNTRIAARSTEDAKTLTDALKGLVALAKLFISPKDDDIAEFLQTIEIDQSGDDVRLSLGVEERLLDKWLSELHEKKAPEALAEKPSAEEAPETVDR